MLLNIATIGLQELRATVSVYRAGGKKPIERHKTRVKVTEENNFFIIQTPVKYQVSFPAKTSYRHT